MVNINGKVDGASRWSLITELLSKLVSPILNMILARLLTPEAFGMVATITMVTSFADIFTDAGFQKYLVQADFKDDEELNKNTNVAFWTNFTLSIIIWGLIAVFRHRLANIAGNPGLGDALAIAACAIPLTSFSSIQMARYRRAFDFKTLFAARLLGIVVPVFVTIPLTFLLKNYWALVYGNLSVQLANSILLTYRSKWKPTLYYSFQRLKKMCAFSLWALLEQLLGWANLNIGIFIVGRFLSEHYLGIYKTSMATSNQIMSIFINAFSPVILASLSRLKYDNQEFKAMFYCFEEKISLFILPLGIGIFIFRDLVTKILLGNQWIEASSFIGLWGLMRSFLVVFGMFSMEVFVALGKPQFSVMSQSLNLIVLIPVLIIAAPKGYNTLFIVRSMVILWSIIVDLVLLETVAGISGRYILRISLPYMIASLLMGGLGIYLLNLSQSLLWQILSTLLCILIYYIVIMINPKSRQTMYDVFKMIKGR